MVLLETYFVEKEGDSGIWSPTMCNESGFLSPALSSARTLHWSNTLESVSEEADNVLGTDCRDSPSRGKSVDTASTQLLTCEVSCASNTQQVSSGLSSAPCRHTKDFLQEASTLERLCTDSVSCVNGPQMGLYEHVGVTTVTTPNSSSVEPLQCSSSPSVIPSPFGNAAQQPGQGLTTIAAALRIRSSELSCSSQLPIPFASSEARKLLRATSVGAIYTAAPESRVRGGNAATTSHHQDARVRGGLEPRAFSRSVSNSLLLNAVEASLSSRPSLDCDRDSVVSTTSYENHDPMECKVRGGLRADRRVRHGHMGTPKCSESGRLMRTQSLPSHSMPVAMALALACSQSPAGSPMQPSRRFSPFMHSSVSAFRTEKLASTASVESLEALATCSPSLGKVYKVRPCPSAAFDSGSAPAHSTYLANSWGASSILSATLAPLSDQGCALGTSLGATGGLLAHPSHASLYEYAEEVTCANNLRSQLERAQSHLELYNSATLVFGHSSCGGTVSLAEGGAGGTEAAPSVMLQPMDGYAW